MPRLIDYASRWEFILDAHDLLVLSRGIHAITLADVAGGAGMSAATLRRVVPSLAAVQATSLRRIERRRARRRLMLPRTDDLFERCLASLMIELAVTPDNRAEDIVRQGILSVAGTHDRVGAAVAESRAGLLDLVESTLDDLGVEAETDRQTSQLETSQLETSQLETSQLETSQLEAIRLVALIEGLNVALLATSDPLDPELARAVFTAHLEGLTRSVAT